MRLLLISDTHGKLGIINALVAHVRADGVIHAGDFGFFDDGSIESFADKFDIIPLGGTKTEPDPPPENLITKMHMGLINDGGPWGDKFIMFMQGETVARIYAHHGLQHKRNVPSTKQS